MTAPVEVPIRTLTAGAVRQLGSRPGLMLAGTRHGNGVTTVQAADPSGIARPRAIYTTGATTNWDSGTYQYDGSGNIRRIGASVFTYDKVNRVTRSDAADLNGTLQSESYAYDAFGNVTQLGATAVSVDAATNRLNGTGMLYDVFGSMTQQPVERHCRD